MNNLNAATLLIFVCLFLPFVLHAQDLSGDSTVVHKMSYEKADSLLIALSKGKSKKVDFINETPSDENVLAADTLISDSLAVDILNLSETELTDPDSISINPDVFVEEVAEKNRKKAKSDRNNLLIQQETGQIILKGEEVNVDYSNLRSINEGTLIGIGGSKMKDTYLSPEKYGGIGFRFMNERMRLTKLLNNKISRQNRVNVDISSTINGAENANFLSAFVDYSLGYHYRFMPDPYFKILLGGSAHGMLGMVYNTRNGNNPMTVHADVDLNFSFIAIYEFRIKKSPLAIRYQFETPFMGVLFSPVYDQSYYEIFSLGNTAEIFNFNSFHNKFAMRNYLTLDFPVGNTTVRAGYLGSYYSTDVNEIDRYIISHNFMLGFVKEFVAFGGREMRKRNLFRSAYY
ncbi:MAG: DUF3316 domain-containing protein [Tannerella sp.]|jgi:hypothetical protein|nr:DUF3316 domain-containing protein [Tannerella sp.]